MRTRRFRIYDLSARLLHDVCLDYASNKYVVDADPKRWTTFIRDCFVTDKYIYLLCPEGEQSSFGYSRGRPIARYRLDEKIFFFFIDPDRIFFVVFNSNNGQSFYFLDLDIKVDIYKKYLYVLLAFSFLFSCKDENKNMRNLF